MTSFKELVRRQYGTEKKTDAYPSILPPRKPPPPSDVASSAPEPRGPKPPWWADAYLMLITGDYLESHNGSIRMRPRARRLLDYLNERIAR